MPRGHLLISTPRTGPVVDEATHRDADGRPFNGATPENCRLLLAKVGFRLLNRWDSEDSLGRALEVWEATSESTSHCILRGEGMFGDVGHARRHLQQ